MSGLRADGQDVREGRVVPLELMDAVCVVPHNEEIRRGGGQGRHAADGLLGVDDPLGVGVLGDAPNALDRWVLNRRLHGVHIRAAVGHGDGDKLEAEGLRDLEVPVIAGGGAEPFDGFLFAPGPGAVEQAVGVGLGDGVVHKLKAGAAPHEDLLHLTAQDVREEPPGGGEAVHLAVVPHVDAVGNIVPGVLHQAENIADQVQLLFSGLAPGHVQAESFRFQGVEFGFQAGVFVFPLRRGERGIRLHKNPSFLSVLLIQLSIANPAGGFKPYFAANPGGTGPAFPPSAAGGYAGETCR